MTHGALDLVRGPCDTSRRRCGRKRRRERRKKGRRSSCCSSCRCCGCCSCGRRKARKKSCFRRNGHGRREQRARKKSCFRRNVRKDSSEESYFCSRRKKDQGAQWLFA